MRSPRVLYRYWRGEDLLYVGRTSSPAARNRHHETHAEWWSLADKVTFEHFATLDELVVAEERAIIDERPAYNVQHNTLNPGRLKYRTPVPLSVIPSDEEYDEMRLAKVRELMDRTFPGKAVAA